MEKRFGLLSGVVNSRKLPLVEIVGSHRVLIENHLGLIEYGENRIIVQTYGSNISIIGNALQLAVITNERIVIKGEVQSVNLDEGGR